MEICSERVTARFACAALLLGLIYEDIRLRLPAPLDNPPGTGQRDWG
jgi:hypothetical protein